jgi:hypothetical protein
LKVLEEKLDKEDQQELDHVLDADVVSKDAQMLDSDGSKIMKIGEYYRNPDQEMFCGNCGAIVTESDVACPECTASFEDEVVAEEKQPKTKGEANA